MLYAVPNPGRRVDLLTRAARAVGLRRLRDDPCAFSKLLEQTICDNDRYFTPRSAPDALSQEEVRLHGGRLEDLVDEAVSLALELYPKRRRDVVLLMIAKHAERLMHRIWSDPWSSGAKLISELGDQHPASPQDGLRKLESHTESRGRTPSGPRKDRAQRTASLELIRGLPDDTDPSAAR